MKKLGINYAMILLLLSLLCACAMKGPEQGGFTTTKTAPRKNLAYNAVLTDPIIKKDFRNLKAAAIKARVYEEEGHSYLADNDIKKLNALSAILIDRLQNHYHLDPRTHKIHTFIGKNQNGSCYEYYDSNSSDIGKDCHSFSHPLDSCQTCNEFVNLTQKRVLRIVHLQSKNATVLIDTFKLRNRDNVYIGLSIS